MKHAAPSWPDLVLRITVSSQCQHKCQLNGDVLCVLLVTARVASMEGCLHRCARTRLSLSIYLSAHARPVVRFNQGQISHSQSLAFHAEAKQAGHAELTFLSSKTVQLDILSTSVFLVPPLIRPDSRAWLPMLDKHCEEMKLSG